MVSKMLIFINPTIAAAITCPGFGIISIAAI
jgi:hypothetical protein